MEPSVVIKGSWKDTHDLFQGELPFVLPLPPPWLDTPPVVENPQDAPASSRQA